MKKYFLHGHLKAQSGKGNELANILLQASEALKQTKGCHIYVISKDLNNEDTIWITEVWDSKEDHDNSLKLEEVRSLIMKAMPIIDGAPQKGQELQALGGLGIN